MERYSLELCFAVNTGCCEIVDSGSRNAALWGGSCDRTCCSLHSRKTDRSLSVSFYCYFFSHDEEVEDPFLAKKIVPVSYAAPRKSCPLGSCYSISTIRIFKFRLLLQKLSSWRLCFSLLCAAISFNGTIYDHGGDGLYLTWKWISPVL